MLLEPLLVSLFRILHIHMDLMTFFLAEVCEKLFPFLSNESANLVRKGFLANCFLHMGSHETYQTPE